MANLVLYRSDDVGAPVLIGAAGSYLSVLDAILVNGYGSKPAAGWTKPFSGTNVAAYRSEGGTGAFLRVDDTSTTLMRLVGYLAMTDVNNGTTPFPTEPQLAGGMYQYKSNSAGTAPRAWYALANNKTLYIHIFSSGTALGVSPASADYVGPIVFTRFNSYVSGDPNNYMLCAGYSPTTNGNRWPSTLSPGGTTFDGIFGPTTSQRVYCPGNYLGAAGSIRLGVRSGVLYTGGVSGPPNSVGAPYPNYPDPITGGAEVSPLWLYEEIGGRPARRGLLPGILHICHPRWFNHMDVISGDGEFAGKSYLGVVCHSGSTEGSMLVEINSDWGL